MIIRIYFCQMIQGRGEGNQQEKEKHRPKPILSIRKVPEGEYCSPGMQHIQKKCIMCGIANNDVRDLSKVIVISIDDSNENYCDSCLDAVLTQEMSEAKLLEQKFIYQKQFETAISESEKKILLVTENDPNSQKLQGEVEQLEAEEKQIDRALEQYGKEAHELQEKVLGLEQKEEKFWSDMNKFEKRAIKLQEKAFIAKNQREIQRNTLEDMSKESIVHQFFQIEIQDSYAQVCGLTVGKKPDQIEINWEETNAALGHILLAYNYLSLKYSIPYTRLSNIKIKGHLSQIQLRTSESYYGAGYGGRESEKTFGVIMQNLLAEMSDLSQHIQEIQKIEYTQQLKLPFQIFKKEGKIVDIFINPSKIEEKNKWSQWTKALRYFLINLKHILTISLLSDPNL